MELLWQLSVHALREVHKRSFAADVATNPLPAPLTDVSYLHAAALLPVTKVNKLDDYTLYIIFSKLYFTLQVCSLVSCNSNIYVFIT